MKRVIKIIFPYILTIALWALPNPRVNPFGILAIVPLFYYMFCRHAPHWGWFGFFICFLLDYNADTFFLFSGAFVLTNAVNILFGVFDQGSGFSAREFNMFFVPLLLALMLFRMVELPGFWIHLVGTLWLYAWIMPLYFVLVALVKRADG